MASVGIIPTKVFKKGPVGLVSRSGTLTYQIGNELAQAGVGNSTIVGIGGDPIVGSSFIDILERFEDDAQTELVVMVGEIGGAEEERAAEYIADHMSKPVVAYIAGFTAPPGKTMGHAGRDHLGLVGDGAGQEGSARSARHPRRHQSDRGRPDRRRARPLDVTGRARRACTAALRLVLARRAVRGRQRRAAARPARAGARRGDRAPAPPPLALVARSAGS